MLNIGAQGTDGPTIHVENAYEGIEGATINIYSGTITVHAEEDGVNAANSDLTDYSYALNIYGGTLYVDAETGDGLDSNGSLDISGGTVTVFSSASGDNAPLDSETRTLIYQVAFQAAIEDRRLRGLPVSGDNLEDIEETLDIADEAFAAL